MKAYKKIALICALAVCMTACGESQSGSESGTAAANSESASNAAADAIQLEAVPYDANDSSNTEIVLNGAAATVSGSGADVSDGTVTISSAGTYVISGTLDDGRIYVNAGKNDIVILILNGVKLYNSSEAALYVENAQLTQIVSAEGTENVIQSGAERDVLADSASDEDASGGAIHAKDDLILTGSGSLAVLGYINNGIHTSNNLLIDSGSYTIKAVNNGIKGKDSVSVTGGTFNISAGGDGVKSDSEDGEGYGVITVTSGEFTVQALGDGFQAETALTISNGVFDVTAGGGSSNSAGPAGGFDQGGRGGQFGDFQNRDINGEQPNMRFNGSQGGDMNSEPPVQWPDMQFDDFQNWDMDDEDTVSSKGFKSGTKMNISGGTFTVDTSDDAFHSNGDAYISDGSLVISSGDDGIHADLSLTADGGNILINKSYEGIEANQIYINGGTLNITSSDDGINANGGQSGFGGEGSTEDMPNLYITGGTVIVNANGDGIDSNGNIYISGGTVTVDGPSDSFNGALDSGSEFGGECLISGGEIIAVGSSGMAETFGGGSAQCSFMYNFSESVPAGSEIAITDANGNILAEHTAAKGFSSVVFSCPQLEQGETYTITAGGQTAEITLDSVSQIEGSAGGMAGNGRGGMNQRQ